MKRLFIIALSVMLAATLYAASPTASSILSGIRKSMLAKPAMEAKFTINGGQGPVQGSITMSGAQFTMTTPQLKVWYDGRTQWTYLASTGEVSITEPTAEELAASNPFVILSSVDRSYDARRLSDVNGCHRVQLTPKDKNSDMQKIVIVTDNTGKQPRAVTVTFSDGRQITLVIDHITGIAKPSERVFRYDEKLQPASEIIDLR